MLKEPTFLSKTNGNANYKAPSNKPVQKTENRTGNTNGNGIGNLRADIVRTHESIHDEKSWKFGTFRILGEMLKITLSQICERFQILVLYVSKFGSFIIFDEFGRKSMICRPETATCKAFRTNLSKPCLKICKNRKMRFFLLISVILRTKSRKK